MSRQSSLFEFEPDPPVKIIKRIQEKAREAIESSDERGVEFVPASDLYDAESREEIELDWNAEGTDQEGSS